MKRDAQKDLELCQKATPGPWEFKQEDDWGVDVGHIENEKKVICDFGDATQFYPVSGEAPEEADLKFILESREALPYWINRAIEAEKLLLEFAYVNPDDSLSDRCDKALKVQEFMRERGYDFKVQNGGGQE